MSDPLPPHGIFLKWGKFQIGAFGIPAILAVCTIVLALLVGRLWAAW